MKTPFQKFGFGPSTVIFRSAGRALVSCAALLLFSPCADAAGSALQFNGSSQYVQISQGESIVLEDEGPRFGAAPTGAWIRGGGNSYHQASDPEATARWTPQLPRAGAYAVYARVSGPPGSLDPAAQYVLKHAGGLSTNAVNQTIYADQWILLGTFDFQANREEFLQLRPSGTGHTVADAVRFVNEQAFDLTQSLTVEAWVKFGATGQPAQDLIAKGDAWALTRYNNYIVFHTRDATGATHDLPTSQGLANDRWYHLAATFDGTRKNLYVDGETAGSAVWQAVLATNRQPVWLGGNAATPSSNYFSGVLENVRIWSNARSQGDLQQYTNRNLRGSEWGLLGDWRFEDSLDDFLVEDSALGALHGSLPQSTPPTSVPGRTFESPLPGVLAVRFNGSTECVRIPSPSDGRFSFTDAGTIEAWVYFDFSPVQRVGLVSSGGSSGWELALDANGKLVFRTGGITGPSPTNTAVQMPAPELLSKTRLGPGTWYHVAAVWDRAAGRKTIYVDGLEDATWTGLQGAVTPTTLAVHFAARPDATGTTGFFEGVLDEVRLWSAARAGADILENFGRDLNGVEPGLAGFWKLDEGSGLVARDQSPYTSKADGMLAPDMTDRNRVIGRTVSAALMLQYCMRLSGPGTYIEVNPTDIFNLSNLTIEAWVKPEGTNLATILQKGEYGFGLAIDEGGYLRFTSTRPPADWPRSTRRLEVERDAQGNPVLNANNLPVWAWNHVAVVVNRLADTTTFYINGLPAGTAASSLVVNNAGPLYLGRGWKLNTTNFFKGLLDEVRLWNLPRSSVEIDLFAFTPLLGSAPNGLVGYWTFNEGSGLKLVDHSGGGRDGSFVGLGISDWQDGTDWGLPALPTGIGGLNPNTNAAGLWVGQVTLNKVNEVQQAASGAAELLADTGHPATVRILLHVAGNGQVRILKDVILMKKPLDTNAPPNLSTNPLAPVDLSAPATNLVLITRPELIPNYSGVMTRGGKLVGLRYGTAAYDFDGSTLPMLGGVGPGVTCLGRINLPKNHPTNPYRHKYHPDHRSGFDIVRQVTMLFDGAPADPWQQAPGYGVDRLTGMYRETVVGLHKIPLRVEGTVRLDRVNSVNVLDDGH